VTKAPSLSTVPPRLACLLARPRPHVPPWPHPLHTRGAHRCPTPCRLRCAATPPPCRDAFATPPPPRHAPSAVPRRDASATSNYCRSTLDAAARSIHDFRGKELQLPRRRAEGGAPPPGAWPPLLPRHDRSNSRGAVEATTPAWICHAPLISSGGLIVLVVVRVRACGATTRWERCGSGRGRPRRISPPLESHRLRLACACADNDNILAR
jgi:hypothetical protein